jgi:hypothetical protein
VTSLMGAERRFDGLPHTTRAPVTLRKRGFSVVLDRSAEGASAYRLSDARRGHCVDRPQGNFPRAALWRLRP